MHHCSVAAVKRRRFFGRMAELVDAPQLKCGDRKVMRVRIPFLPQVGLFLIAERRFALGKEFCSCLGNAGPTSWGWLFLNVIQFEITHL